MHGLRLKRVCSLLADKPSESKKKELRERSSLRIGRINSAKNLYLTNSNKQRVEGSKNVEPTRGLNVNHSPSPAPVR
jgi:hypothetical protein